MNDINKIKRNIVIFTIFITICGWIGYFIDKLTGQANYENIGTVTGNDGSPGLLMWLVSPLICTIILRTFAGDGWKDTGTKRIGLHCENDCPGGRHLSF